MADLDLGGGAIISMPAPLIHITGVLHHQHGREGVWSTILVDRLIVAGVGRCKHMTIILFMAILMCIKWKPDGSS